MWVLAALACHQEVEPPSAETGALEPPAPVEPEGELVENHRRWLGSEPFDQAGWALDAGDVEGDGQMEVLVGAPSTFIEGPDAVHSSAYLLRVSSESGYLDEVASVWFHGTANGDGFGNHLAIPGDLTGDGAGDVAIAGSNGLAEPLSQLQVFAGPLASEVEWGEHVSRLAVAGNVVDCGDVSGDGVVDLCGGSTSVTFIYRGPLPPGFVAAEQAATELVAPEQEQAGATLVGGHDLDGDGIADLVVGANKRQGERGGAYLVSRPELGVVDLHGQPAWTGEAEGDQAGLGLATGGDLDGDGQGDLYIGAHIAQQRMGRGYVVTTMQGGSLADAHTRLDGKLELDWFGARATIGDLDDDGMADLAVGIPRDIYLGLDRPGRVAVFAGPLPSGLLDESSAITVFRGTDHPDAFGFGLVAANLDGEGGDDIVVAAPLDETTGPSAGAVYLFLASSLF